MRIRTSLIATLSIILTAGVIAGEKANYSGIWILNKDKCELDETGKILTVKHNSSSDWGDRFITMAFDKTSDDPKK